MSSYISQPVNNPKYAKAATTSHCALFVYRKIDIKTQNIRCWIVEVKARLSWRNCFSLHLRFPQYRLQNFAVMVDHDTTTVARRKDRRVLTQVRGENTSFCKESRLASFSVLVNRKT